MKESIRVIELPGNGAATLGSLNTTVPEEDIPREIVLQPSATGEVTFFASNGIKDDGIVNDAVLPPILSSAALLVAFNVPAVFNIYNKLDQKKPSKLISEGFLTIKNIYFLLNPPNRNINGYYSRKT